MDYWAETMQDDVYSIAADGWAAKTHRILEADKNSRRDKHLQVSTHQNPRQRLLSG